MKKYLIIISFCLFATALIHAYPTIVNPNGGEKWQKGVIYTIQWLPDNTSARLDIYLIKGGISKGLIASNVENTGIYKWKITKLLNGWNIVPGKDYRIKTKYIADPALHDLSNAMFTILPFKRHVKALKLRKYPSTLKIETLKLKKVDFTVKGVGKKNSTGGRYISYTIKNLNYQNAKITNPVYLRVGDKNSPSKRKIFTVFSWAVLIEKFNKTGTYTANVPIPADWGLIIELEIDPFKHVDEINETNNISIVNYLVLKRKVLRKLR